MIRSILVTCGVFCLILVASITVWSQPNDEFGGPEPEFRNRRVDAEPPHFRDEPRPPRPRDIHHREERGRERHAEPAPMEPEGQIAHLREAAELLKRCGRMEMAEHLMHEAEEIERDLHRAREREGHREAPPEIRELHEQMEHLHHQVAKMAEEQGHHRLREEVQQMRKELENTRQMLRQMAEVLEKLQRGHVEPPSPPFEPAPRGNRFEEVPEPNEIEEPEVDFSPASIDGAS